MQFLFVVYVFIILLLAGLSFGRDVPRLRNVLVILADDHALHVTGAYGNERIRTPNIDELAQEGVTFTQAYCNAPICSASRQSLLTGKYPHTTGVNLLFTPFPDEGNRTIAEHLRESGYQTALIGKSHFNNWMWQLLYKAGMPTHGFNTLIQRTDYQRFVENQNMPPLPEDMEFYTPDSAKRSIAEWMNCRVLPQPVFDDLSEGTFFAQKAIEFMTKNRQKPFLLWLAFHEPHHPYYFPLEYSARYDPDEIPLPTGSPEDDRWIPQKFRHLTDAEKRGIIASYYTSTEYLDKNIGLVVDALDSLGLDQNTAVVYISDNGYFLNDHKRFEKHSLWQEAVHQPMIIRPGSERKGGRRSAALIEYIDVVPTLLDMLGLPALEDAQGSSFLHLFADINAEHRRAVFSEYLVDNKAMIRTQRWKYIFSTGRRDFGLGYCTGYGPSGIDHRLYHLPSDPQESHDVSEEAKNRVVLERMQELMLQRFLQTHPQAHQCPQSLTRVGKLVWFCEPRDIGSDQSFDAHPYRVFETE